MVDDSNIYRLEVHYGGTSTRSSEGALLEEAHTVVVESADGHFRLTQCTCTTCLRSGYNKLLLATPSQLADYVAKNATDRQIAIVFATEMMTERLPNGQPTIALRLGKAVADAISTRGTNVWIGMPGADMPRPKTWVRFTQDRFICPKHIIVAGMLGEVVPGQRGAYQPSASLHVVPVGLETPYRYDTAGLEVLGEEPSDSEIAEAVRLCRHALDEIIRRHGWCGFVPVKNQRIPESRARRELVKLCEQIGRNTEQQQKEVRGLLRRLSAVLKGFSQHSNGQWAIALSRRCDLRPADAPLQALLSEVKLWAIAPL